jgi:hypothetical protein
MTNTQIDRLLSMHAELYGRNKGDIGLLIRAPTYNNGGWISCVSVCSRLDQPLDQFLYCTKEEHTIEDAFKAFVAKIEPLLRKLLQERRAHLSNLIAVLDG